MNVLRAKLQKAVDEGILTSSESDVIGALVEYHDGSMGMSQYLPVFDELMTELP